MKSSRILGRVALVAPVLLLAVACNRQPATDVASTATLAPAAEATIAPAAESATPAIASVKVGRWIHPKTFAIGGVATSFKQGDKLFAAVQLENLVQPAVVDVKLVDAQGADVATDTKTIAPKGTMRANFALAKDAPLAAGNYTLTATLEGGATEQVDLVVQ